MAGAGGKGAEKPNTEGLGVEVRVLASLIGSRLVPQPSNAWLLGSGILLPRQQQPAVKGLAGFEDPRSRYRELTAEQEETIIGLWRKFQGVQDPAGGDESDDDEDDVRDWLRQMILAEAEVSSLLTLGADAPSRMELKRILNLSWKRSRGHMSELELRANRRPGPIRKEERIAAQNRWRKEQEQVRRDDESIKKGWELDAKRQKEALVKKAAERKAIFKSQIEAQRQREERGLKVATMRSELAERINPSLSRQRAWESAREQAHRKCNDAAKGSEPEASVEAAVNAGFLAFGQGPHKDEMASECAELLGSAATAYVRAARKATSRGGDARPEWEAGCRIWKRQEEILVQLYGPNHHTVAKCQGNIAKAQKYIKAGQQPAEFSELDFVE